MRHTLLHWVAIAGALAPTLMAQGPLASVALAIDRPIVHYESHGAPIREALQRLMRDRDREFVIGFEQVPESGPPLGDEHILNLMIDNGTVGQVLREMCAQDTRYTFNEPIPGVVNVYPAVENPEVRAIFSVSVAAVDIDVNDWYANLFSQIRTFAPELRAYLDSRARDYQMRHGLPAIGSPGIGMSTNVVPPHVRISLRNTTVRGALNQIAAYTLSQSMDPQLAGNINRPTGWEFRFALEPNARSGLGGSPSWGPF